MINYINLTPMFKDEISFLSLYDCVPNKKILDANTSAILLSKNNPKIIIGKMSLINIYNNFYLKTIIFYERNKCVFKTEYDKKIGRIERIGIITKNNITYNVRILKYNNLMMTLYVEEDNKFFIDLKLTKDTEFNYISCTYKQDKKWYSETLNVNLIDYKYSSKILTFDGILVNKEDTKFDLILPYNRTIFRVIKERLNDIIYGIYDYMIDSIYTDESIKDLLKTNDVEKVKELFKHGDIYN